MFTRFCLWILLYLGGGRVPFLLANARPLSAQATVSVLTCAPGTETYALFGHSALRITDPMRGFDRVYNYGTFDFATPHFYGRFMRGDLRYFLSVTSFAEFLAAYREENRVVSEQVLVLQPLETQRLYTYLEATLHSSARFYRYQFFADNCTTRLWRDIHASIETPLQVDTTYALPARSYRQLLAPYLAPAPWVNLGMNLGLGWPADRATTFNQQVFLPVALQEALQHARRAHRPFARPAQHLFVAQAFPSSPPSWWTPTHCVLSLGILLLLAQGLPHRYHLLQRVIRFALLASVGLVGCLLLGLMLFSLHAPVQLNYQLLWLLPTHVGLAVARPTRRWRQYASVAAGLLVLSGLGGWIIYYAHLPVIGLLLLVLLLQLVLFIRPVSNRQLLIGDLRE